MSRNSTHEMPLYPDEQQLARAVVGPARARSWDGLAVVLERHGFPRIDPQFGGRYWPAVRAFLDRRNGIDNFVAASDVDAGQENWIEPHRPSRPIRPRAKANEASQRTR